MSDWVKYGSLTVFLWYVFSCMSLDSVHMQENVAHRKPLYLHILCIVQLSLGTTFFSNALSKFCAWSTKLATLTSCSAFFLQRQVTLLISGSLTIHLLGSNTESTEFQPNTTDSNWFLKPISDFNMLEVGGKNHTVLFFFV